MGPVLNFHKAAHRRQIASLHSLLNPVPFMSGWFVWITYFCYFYKFVGKVDSGVSFI